MTTVARYFSEGSAEKTGRNMGAARYTTKENIGYHETSGFHVQRLKESSRLSAERGGKV